MNRKLLISYYQAKGYNVRTRIVWRRVILLGLLLTAAVGLLVLGVMKAAQLAETMWW
jgi:hypothetical protein